MYLSCKATCIGLVMHTCTYMPIKICAFMLLASSADMDSSEMSVKFKKRQRSATVSIKIADDDVVENVESFVVRLTLPSKEVRDRKLKYGDHQYAVVYIKDSE